MANYSPAPLDVVAIDIETVSLHPAAEVWEFGAVRRNADGSHTTKTIMLANPNLRHADLQALRIGRFYDRHPHAITTRQVRFSERLSPHSILRGRLAFAQEIAGFTHDAVLLVNNPTFDVPRLELLLRGQGILPSWYYRPVDVVALAAGALVGGAIDDEDLLAELAEEGPVSSWGSAFVSERLGVRLPSDDERHTALGDARWVLRLYDAALGQDNPADGRAAPAIVPTSAMY